MPFYGKYSSEQLHFTEIQEHRSFIMDSQKMGKTCRDFADSSDRTGRS